MTDRIDAHQHYWRVDRGDYHWMPPTGVLHRDWLPTDLAPLNADAGISATVAVQAAQTIAETDFLLGLAEDEASDVAAVVGWVDLDAVSAPAELERLAAHPKVAAIRPMLQDLLDPGWILRSRVRENIGRLAGLGLAFEVLSYPGHLPYAFEVLSGLPDLRVIVDHLSKPVYEDPPQHLWRTWIQRFAERDATAMKISGMVTEMGPGWSVDRAAPLVRIAIDAFGPERLMFGSDWPVCRQVATHAQVVTLADELTAGFSVAEQQRFWSGTAREYYALGD